MSDFDKEVAKTERGIKADFERSVDPKSGSRSNLDKAVAEQVNADLDAIIKKHDDK